MPKDVEKIKPKTENEKEEVVKKKFYSGTEIELPGGFVDKDGKIHKKVIIDEMTGEDEENLSASKNRANPGKVMTILLTRIVQKIGDFDFVTDKMINRLILGDRDFLLINLRQVSVGNILSMEVNCPKCSSKDIYDIDLSQLETKACNKDELLNGFGISLPKGIVTEEGAVYKKVMLSFPTGEVQEKMGLVMDRNPGEANTILIHSCIKSVEGIDAVTRDMVKKMKKLDRDTIAKALQDRMPGPDLNMDFSCPQCSDTFKQVVDFTNFFTPGTSS